MACASARMPRPDVFSERKSSSMMTMGKRNFIVVLQPCGSGPWGKGTSGWEPNGGKAGAKCTEIMWQRREFWLGLLSQNVAQARHNHRPGPERLSWVPFVLETGALMSDSTCVVAAGGRQLVALELFTGHVLPAHAGHRHGRRQRSPRTWALSEHHDTAHCCGTRRVGRGGRLCHFIKKTHGRATRPCARCAASTSMWGKCCRSTSWHARWHRAA